MLWIRSFATFILGALLLATSALGDTFSDDYVNIKSRVDELWPDYSASDRLGVATTVQKMMQIFVNRESKIKNYGIDSNTTFDQILADVGKLNNTEFHTRMQDSFSALRDLHTSYYMPAPYNCFSVYWPLYFTPVHTSAYDIVANVSVRVSAYSAVDSVLQRFPGLSTKVSIGDELVTINGLTVPDFVKIHARNSAGANDFGALRRVLEDYSYRSTTRKLLPNETTVDYVLKTRSGRHYTISGNVTVVYEDYCVVANFNEKGTATKLSESDSQLFTKTKSKSAAANATLALKSLNLGLSINNDFVEMYSAFNHSQAAAWTNYDYDVLQYQIVQRKDSTVGVIQLSSFEPYDYNYDRVIRDIRSLLTNEMKDTNALIIDVRNNGGGYAQFADRIPQLFKNNITTSGGQAIVHPFNKIIYNDMGGEFKEAYDEVKDGDKYTPLMKYTSNEAANIYGVVYLKPVGVLTNSECFSACELFAANMQNLGIATIIGEDGTTGGGGANVLEYTSYLNAYWPDIFEALPKNASDAGQDYRVGWRQTVRTGKYEGQLIEDIGVVSDVVIRPSVSDLYLNSTQDSWQLTLATEYLLNLGRDNHTIHRSFFLDLDASNSHTVHSPYHGGATGLQSFVPSIGNLTITGTASKLNTATISDSTGKLVGTVNLGYTTNPKAFSAISTIQPSLTPSLVTLKGYKDGEHIFSTNRTVFHPPLSNFYSVTKDTNVTWDFTTGGFANIYNAPGTNAEDGWNIFTTSDGNKAVRIGDGVQYKDNVHTTLSFLLKLPENISDSTFRLNFDIDIENGYDWFYVTLSTTTGPAHIETWGGQFSLVDYEMSVPYGSFAGQYVEVSFKFLSDSYDHYSGINITSLQFKF